MLVIDVINGDMMDNVPGLLDRYDKAVIPCGDVLDERAHAALTGHADKLIIESPGIFAQTILRDIAPSTPAGNPK